MARQPSSETAGGVRRVSGRVQLRAIVILVGLSLLGAGIPAFAQEGPADAVLEPPFEEFSVSGTAAADPTTGTLVASAAAAEDSGAFFSIASVAASHAAPSGIAAIDYVLDATVLWDTAAAQGSFYAWARAGAVIWIEAVHDGCLGCVARTELALASAPTGDEQMSYEVGERREVALEFALDENTGGNLPAGTVRVAVGLAAHAESHANFPGLVQCDRGGLVCTSEAVAVVSASVVVNRITGHFVASIDELPDLAVTDFRMEPASPNSGDPVSLTAVVENLGMVSASSFAVSFEIDDGQKLARRLVDGIAPGASTTVEASWIAEEGEHSLRVVADADFSVTETDESNNEATVVVTVAAAPVRAVDLSPESQSGSVARKGAITYVLQVTNLGGDADTIHLAKTPDQGGWRASLNTTEVRLEAGHSATIGLEITAPNKDSAFRVEVTATSQADPGASDVAVAETNTQ